MSLICDYFLAGSDGEAAATGSWPGGPGSPAGPRRGLFRRPAEAPAPLPNAELPGLDPVVMLATAEALLLGRAADELAAANADAQVNDPADGVLVFRVSPALTAGLAAATPERLAEVAVPWSATEEFGGEGDPEALTEALARLADLAQLARSRGGQLYCWTSAWAGPALARDQSGIGTFSPGIGAECG